MSTFGIAQRTIWVGFFVLGLKLWGWRVTGSVALLSDALESLVNVAAAIFATWAIWYSQRPPDEDHPYGHSKAEYLSAVFEGALIVLASGAIIYTAVLRLLVPGPVRAPEVGIGFLLLASLLNGLWALYLIRVGRARRSAALEADGWHLFGDVATSVGVLAGLLIAWLSGIWIFDPLVALVVAGHILVMGLRLMKGSVGGLLDEAIDAKELGEIEQAIKAAMTGALEAHDIRTRRAGQKTFVEFHLVVPAAMTVEDAHRIADRIERAVAKVVPGAEVTIHVEPEGEMAHKGIRIEP